MLAFPHFLYLVTGLIDISIFSRIESDWYWVKVFTMPIAVRGLTSQSSLVLLFIILLLYILLRRVYLRFCHLQKFSGPRFAGYTRYWLLRAYSSGDSARIFVGVNKRYGKHCFHVLVAHSKQDLSIVQKFCLESNWPRAHQGKLARIGPNHLLTDDADLNYRILGPNSKYQRGKWFDSLRFDPHYTSIASETDPVKHDALRWKVSAGVCS